MNIEMKLTPAQAALLASVLDSWDGDLGGPTGGPADPEDERWVYEFGRDLAAAAKAQDEGPLPTPEVRFDVRMPVGQDYAEANITYGAWNITLDIGNGGYGQCASMSEQLEELGVQVPDDVLVANRVLWNRL